MPQTILYVDHARALGGAEQSLLLLLRHLDRERFQPLLACPPGALAEAARALGVTVLPVALPRLRGEPAALLRLAATSTALANAARHAGAALVHCNVLRAAVYAVPAALLSRLPLVWHVRDMHGPGTPGGTWFPRLMCRAATRTIAISRAVAAPLPCPDRTIIIHNGVDLAEFTPEGDTTQLRSALGTSPGVPLVGIVGRVWPWKGQADFLRAAALVARAHPDACFLVVGDAVFATDHDYLGELRALAAGLGIDERVHFTGYRTDVPRIMAALDLVVHCSRAEPFGRVLIEAMAAGRPVVAYADGGVPEIVVDGTTGLLAPPGDVAALAQAIDRLLHDRQLRERMGRAGRARVVSRFDARAVARAVEAVYAEILGTS